jgi:hypothetical protein
MSRRSPIFQQALDQWRAMRQDFELLHAAAFDRAVEETRGVMLNARGMRAGIDPWSLFIGPAVRAHAYASEELLDHWSRYPRITVAQYEQQITAQWQHDERESA